MAIEKIIIKFKPEGDKRLIASIKRLDAETRKLMGKTAALGDTTKKTDKKLRNLNNTFSVMRSKLLLVNFAMAMGARQLIAFTKEAAKLESMERAFNTLSGGVGNASIAMDKLEEATDGTMSRFDLFQQANNAMILGVSKNSDEMAEMFDIAQRLGRALGKDTRMSVESLITGIGRQCLTEDSFISTDNGLKQITDIKKGDVVLSKNDNDEIIETVVTHLHYNGIHPVYIVTFKDGKFIKSTDNHRYFTDDGWKYLSELDSGSKVLNIDNNYSIIHSIIALGNEKVYDLTVPETANFYANGLCVHNSRLMLDNIGIIVKADEAYGQYAEKLGTTADKLTDAQKKQAFLSATMESAREKVASLGDEILSSQDSYDELGASLDNAAVVTGQFVAALLNLPKAAEGAATALYLMANVLKTSFSKESMGEWTVFVLENVFALGKQLSGLNAVTEAIDSYSESAEKAKEEIRGAQGEYEKWLQRLEQGKEQEFIANMEIFANEFVDGAKRVFSAQAEVIEAFNQDSETLLNKFWIARHTSQLDNLAIEQARLEEAARMTIDNEEFLQNTLAQIRKHYADKEGKENKLRYATSLTALRNMIKSKIQIWTAEAIAGFVAKEISTKGWVGLLTASAGAIAIDKFFQDHVPQFEQGGFIGGSRHSQGGTMINAEQGEFVMNRKAVDSIGVNNLNNMNEGGGGAITVNINGGMISQEFVENELAEAISTAVRRGSSFA